MIAAGIELGRLMNLELKFRDLEGRPLAENKVPAHYQQDVPMELSECPYPGSRHRHAKLMNLSALKQMTNHWSELLGLFAAFRDQALLPRNAQQTNLLEYFRVTVAGYLLPSYLFYQAENPIEDGQLPASVAALYKAALGMVSTGQLMLAQGIVTGRYRYDMLVDGELLHNFADQEGLFIGANEVCAGPPNMIKEVLQTMTLQSAGKASLSALQQDFNVAQYFDYVRAAEQVLLLDYLFPIICYFEINAPIITELFQILRGVDGGRAVQAASGISMELQILEIISPILDSLNDDQQREINQSLWSLITEIDQSGQLASLFHSSLNAEQVDQFADELTELIADDDRLSLPEQLVATRVLAYYLLLERKKLIILDQLQRQMNSRLSRSDQLRRPDSLDLRRMYNKKLTDAVADLLNLRIENQIDQTMIERGPNKLML